MKIVADIYAICGESGFSHNIMSTFWSEMGSGIKSRDR